MMTRNRLTTNCIRSKVTLKKSGLQPLEHWGISKFKKGKTLKLVEITFHGTVFQGVGIRNIKKGLEVICPEIGTEPFTVGRRGVTVIPFVRGFANDGCCLFLDLMDYLLFVQEDKGILGCYDAVIMNGIRNIYKLLTSLKAYKKCLCIMPYDMMGQVIALTLEDKWNTSVKILGAEYEKIASKRGSIINNENIYE
jgi:hypothetical protein